MCVCNTSTCVAVWEREQGAIKVADIGHLYAELSVHIKWSERLEEEMWRQGDVEKARNMKVFTISFAFSSPVCPCVCQHKTNCVSFPKPDAAWLLLLDYDTRTCARAHVPAGVISDGQAKAGGHQVTARLY